MEPIAYVDNQPLMLVDSLGTCPSVKLNDPNSGDGESSGEFGPYESEDATAAGGEGQDPTGYSSCAEPAGPSVMIDGVLMDAGLGGDFESVGGGPLGGGSPSVGAAYACAWSNCQGASAQIDQWGNEIKYVYIPGGGGSCSYTSTSGRCTLSFFKGYTGPLTSPGLGGSCGWADLGCQFFAGFVDTFVNNKPSGLLHLGYAESAGVAIGASSEIGNATVAAYNWVADTAFPAAQNLAYQVGTNPYLAANILDCAAKFLLSNGPPPVTPLGFGCLAVKQGLGALGWGH